MPRCGDRNWQAGGRAAGRGRRLIEETPDGLAVHLGATKTDQTGEGDVIGIPYGTNVETCPVRSLQGLAGRSGITTGPAFRAIDRHGHMAANPISDKAVATIVKRAVKPAKYLAGPRPRKPPPPRVLRATACGQGSQRRLPRTMRMAMRSNDMRHKRFDTTQGYIRGGELFKKNAAGMAGL